jgi:hypothetical protein
VNIMQQVRVAVPDPLPAADMALLDSVGPVEEAHVLVIGDATLGMLCGLIRRGCTAAAEMQLHDRPITGPVEIVVVPRLERQDGAVRAVELARRVLQPGGRIVLRDATGALAQETAALLRRHGFSAVAVRPWSDGALISAERPGFGPFARG